MKNKFAVLRLIIYIAVFTAFALIPVSIAERGSLCIIYHLTGYKCAGCGSTRAFSNIMHFNISRAFEFNSFFTLCLFPIGMLFIINDIYSVICRLILKKDKTSFLEKMFML